MRKTFNLQDEKQMEELRKLLGGDYVKRNKTNGRRMGADKKHPSSVASVRETTGDD